MSVCGRAEVHDIYKAVKVVYYTKKCMRKIIIITIKHLSEVLEMC